MGDEDDAKERLGTAERASDATRSEREIIVNHETRPRMRVTVRDCNDFPSYYPSSSSRGLLSLLFEDDKNRISRDAVLWT